MSEAPENETNTTDRIGVFGIGNILLLDEGVGPEVAHALERDYEFPSNVDIMDRGTMGYALIGDFENYDYILTVDAVDGTGEEPGTVFTFDPADMAANPCDVRGAHDTRFSDVLLACDLMGRRPNALCVGVQIENMSPAEMVIGLTPKVNEAIPLLCETVLALLWKHGVRGMVDKRTGQEVRPPK